jgi:hypothetical protein
MLLCSVTFQFLLTVVVLCDHILGSRIEKQVPHAKLNKVVRAECTDSTRVVGLQMPGDTVEQIMQALSQRLPANESTPKMELALRNLQLNADAAATVVRLCDFLQSSSAAGAVVNICGQLTPAIVSAINTHSLPDQLEELITYLEGAFPALREARTEKRIMKFELAQLLIQSVSGTKNDGGLDNEPGNPEPVAKVRAKILTKLQEANRQHAERQQRREAEKKRAQAGLDDDDDDFAEVKQSPINPRASAAPRSSSKKARKSKKLHKPEAKDNASSQAKSEAAAAAKEKSAKTAAQMRLNRAAADKTQQRLGFSSLSAINKDKADGRVAGTSKQPQQPRRLCSSAATPCDDASVPAPIRSTSGELDFEMIEGDDEPVGRIEITSDEENEGAHGKRSRVDDAEDPVSPQPLKRVRVCLRSGQDASLKFKNVHMELQTGQNLLSFSSDSLVDSMQIAGGTQQLPDPAKEFVAVYVSERHDAVLMSSTAIGHEVSVVSDRQSEPAYLSPHVPIILADGDTIELRGN